MNNINLKQLETFVKVVELGSFTKAASHLFLAQSTVSAHVQAMEVSLGMVLFDRNSKRNISLTPDGHRTYQFARDILMHCEMLEKRIIDVQKSQIFVGASTVPSETVLPGLINRFLGIHSEASFVVKNGDSGQIQKQLVDGTISIGFMGTSDNRQDLIYEKLTEDRLVMIAPKNAHYIELHQKGAYGRQLLNEPVIFRESGSGTQKVIDNYLSEIDIDEKKLNIVAYVSNCEMQKKLVLLGTGVAIVSELLVREMLISEQVLHFEMDKNPISRCIYMAQCRGGVSSPLASEFAQFVKKSYAERRDR